MTEPENFYEAPETPVVGNTFLVHRPLINLIAATFFCGLGAVGLTLMGGLLAGLESLIDNHGGWEVFLHSKSGLLRIFVWLMITASSVTLCVAGCSFFRVRNRKAKAQLLTALAIGFLAILIPLVSP